MKKIKNQYAKKYTFTYTELQKLIQERVNIMQDVTLAIVAMQLRDQYDFGTKRVKRVLKAVNETINDINNNIITVEDIFDVIENELKLSVRRKGVKYPKNKEEK